MNRLYSLFLIVLSLTLVISFLSCSSPTDDDSDNSNAIDTLKVGVIIPISGDGPFQKDSESALVSIAINDINSSLEENSSKKYIKAEIVDSKSDAEEIIAAVQNFEEKGIDVIVQTSTSSNLQAISDFVNENNMLLLNNSSTAVELSQDDNIFRLVPNDIEMSKKIAEFAESKGIENLLVIHRNDLWGEGLSQEIVEQYESRAKTVINEWGYETRFQEDDINEILSEVNDTIAEISSTIDINKIGIVCISYNEGIDILELAANYENLDKVNWLGSDGMVENTALLTDSVAAEFSSKVGFYCPIVAEPDNQSAADIKNQVSQETGYEPYSWIYFLYDALQLSAKTVTSEDYHSTTKSLKEVLLTEAENYSGVTGSIDFDTNGDRSSYLYDFWYVEQTNGSYKWTKVIE
jgi:branched-chain amino acid transport system substrate-binding protein